MSMVELFEVYGAVKVLGAVAGFVALIILVDVFSGDGSQSWRIDPMCENDKVIAVEPVQVEQYDGLVMFLYSDGVETLFLNPVRKIGGRFDGDF